MNKTFEVYSYKEVYEWAAKIAKEYNKSKDYIQTMNDHKFPYTICCNLKTGKIGKSKCHPDDTFSYTIALAFAYARLMDLPEPKLVEKTYRLDECIGKVISMNNRRYYVVGTSEDKTYCILKNKNNGCLYEYKSDIKIRTSNIKE